jgi:hypothetical protein
VSELIIGKFEPPTLAHIRIIQQMINPIVVVVHTKVSKQKPFSKEIISRLFSEYEIFPYFIETGYIVDILDILEITPEYLICGSDRYKKYQEIIDKNKLSLQLKEVKRLDSDISATKVRYSLISNDEVLFRKLMPYKFWPYFEELKQICQNLK